MGLTTVIKDYGTEILNAIRENDLQKLKTILEKHLKADKKIQKLCIADIKHKPTKKFACPLILAARQEDPRIMKYMMDKGVDPNFVHHTIFSSKRKEIVTALHISVDLGLYDTVQILLDANADANIGDHNQETPLHISVKKADKVMTRMLLSKGADPKIPDRRGNAALHVATLYGHLQLVRTLLKYDADVYQKGQWDAVPPHIAAKEGHIHLIQLFCSRDVGNINIKIPCYLDKREKAPIHLSAENGHVETVLALVDQFDAEVNLKDSDGNTPLHCVVLNQYNPHRMRDKEYFNETAKVLIKFGVGINEKNMYGDTALHLAAMNQFQRIVELLLEIGSSPFIENDEKLKPIDVVPDFDPVTKQVLKNAMLNPRPAISASRSTLLSRDLSMMSGHDIFRKPRSLGSLSPEPVIPSMHRSHSKGSISSSVTIESSVFEDPLRNNNKYQDPYHSHRHGHGHKSRRPPSSNESERFEDEDRHSNVLYSKVNKPKKQASSSQQTDQKLTQSYGTQYDNEQDESVSMISVQDHMTQVSMKTESTVVNNALRNIINKDRKQRRPFDDDDRIESVSDITSLPGSESTYMSMEGKRRPKPKPRPGKSTEDIYRQHHNDGIVYENLKGDIPPPLPSRSRNQSTTSLNQKPEKNPNSGQQQQQGQAGIRLIPGKNGTIEVQYGGYGGTPLTIQFDTSQFGLTPSSDSQGNLVLNNDKSGYQDNDQFSSFSIDTVQTAQSEAYQPGFTPGNYGYRAGDLSMDSTEMESSHVSDVHRDAVRNAIQQTVYDMTSNRQADGQQLKQPQAEEHIYQNDDVEYEDDVTSASQLNKQQIEAQQAHTQQQLQQAMEQLQHFELNQNQLQSIHQQLQQLMEQQQQLQQQHLKFQEEQQKALAEAKTKKKKGKSSKQAAKRPTQEPPALPVQPPPPPPLASSSPPEVQETFVISEDEVKSSPKTPNEEPKYMNFAQALAFAKEVESKSAENSPITQRRKKPELQEDAFGQSGPVPKPRQQVRNGPPQRATHQIVTTPEKHKWDVKPGTATTVEMSGDASPAHVAHVGNMGQMRQATVQSNYITQSSTYVSSADVASHAFGQKIEVEQSESEESEEQTEEEEERPPFEIYSQMTSKPVSHDMYYSLTQESAYQETPSHHFPDEINSYQSQRAQQAQQAAMQPLKVSDAVPDDTPTGDPQLEEHETSVSMMNDEKCAGGNVESGKDELSNLDDQTGSKRKTMSLDDIRVLSVTTSSPEPSVTSPTPLELLRRSAKTPESFISSTCSSRSALNMRVTGEVPKAYNRATKGVARRAFMLHPPVGIESNSEASDNEYYDSPSHRSSRLSSRSLYSPSSALSPARSPTIFEFKEPIPDKPRGGVLLGASIPKPYKSFGKIETRTDALEEAIAEAEAIARAEMQREIEIHASRQEVEEAKQALIQKHIGAHEELQKEGITPDLPTSPVEEQEYTILHIEQQKKHLPEVKLSVSQQEQNEKLETSALVQDEDIETEDESEEEGEDSDDETEEQSSIVEQHRENAPESIKTISVEQTNDESSTIIKSKQEQHELETQSEEESEEEESEDEKSSESSSSSDQGEFNFETGEISAQVEDMDEFEDIGPIEPFESVMSTKKKPRPKVDPEKVEAARKAAEARKSPAHKKGKLSTAAHGGVGQPVSVSVSKAMMRRRMSPRRTPILAETIEETEEPIEEENDEDDSDAETGASSEMSEQRAHDKSSSTVSVQSREDSEEEHLKVIENGTTTDRVLSRTVCTNDTVTVVEQRVRKDGDVETVSTTVVQSGGHGPERSDVQYLEIEEGDLDTSSEIEKYDENFETGKHTIFSKPANNVTNELPAKTKPKEKESSIGSQSKVDESGGTVMPPMKMDFKQSQENAPTASVNIMDDEDDEVAQISAAAYERKVKKKKKKAKSSVQEGEGEGEILKKKKTKKKKTDSQTGATGLTSEIGAPGLTSEREALEEETAKKVKKKKTKSKDGTEVKKKKKKGKNSAANDQVAAENHSSSGQEQQIVQKQEIGRPLQQISSMQGANEKPAVMVPLSINTHTVTHQHAQHSALDPLSPARSDTSEISVGTPEGLEATFFGSKLERQETVKENKDSHRKAGFWSNRQTVKEEQVSPESKEDISRQYKSAVEGPDKKYNMEDNNAHNPGYLDDSAQMHKKGSAPSNQRQPPIGQEDHSELGSHIGHVQETDIDQVSSSFMNTESKDAMMGKPAIPKKPKHLNKQSFPKPLAYSQELLKTESVLPDSRTRWGQSRETSVTTTTSSFDETQAVSQLWKENDQHEAEMQRILASVTEGSGQSDTTKHATVGVGHASFQNDDRQMQKLNIEGQTFYADEDSEVTAQLQSATFGRQVPGKTIGASPVVRPQPVYASAKMPKPVVSQVDDSHGKYTEQYQDNYVPVPSAKIHKRGAEEEAELNDEQTTNFQRQVSIRGKKKKRRELPEGMSGAISDTEALKYSVGHESDVGIHSEAEVHDADLKYGKHSLQVAAMEALSQRLKHQPKLRPRRPIWETEVPPIHYTRGVYRPNNPPTLYGSRAYHGSYDDSALVAQMFTEQNKPSVHTESEGEADTEGAESPVSFRPPHPQMSQHAHFANQHQMIQQSPIAPHAFSAFQPVSPSMKKVTIVDKNKKAKKKKGKPIKTEPDPVDFDQYSATARLWMEQVDMKTVEKSQTMKMAIMSENQRPPAELVKSLPDYEMASDDVFLPPQWILIRGRTLRGRKQASSFGAANRSYASESDFDINADRPLSPGRQSILFFRLGNNWKDLAWVLFDGLLSDADTLRMIRDIQLKNPGNIRDQVNDMMRRWWKKRGSTATIDELQRALDVVHTAYIQEDFFNRRSTITSYTDTEDDLEIGEVEDNDPDVSRIIGEYEVRSLNSSFECDPPAISGKPVNRDVLLQSLHEKGLHRGRHNISRDSVARYSTTSSGHIPDLSFRHDLSLDETSDKFMIIQPQLKHQEYRHETTI